MLHRKGLVRSSTTSSTASVRPGHSAMSDHCPDYPRKRTSGKMPDQTLDQAFRLPEVLVAVSASRLSCKRAGKTRTLMPVWDSSGESRLNLLPRMDSQFHGE